MENGEKGVTLIALVVTIIVLLIISGISLTTFISEDGILNQANDATSRSTKRKYSTKNRS